MKPYGYSERFEEAKAILAAGMARVRNTPEPAGQKFRNGSFVWIAKDLGDSMRHFENDRPARVEHTYAHAFGGQDVESYSLLIRGEAKWYSVSWYYESQLTPITDAAQIAGYEREIKCGKN